MSALQRYRLEAAAGEWVPAQDVARLEANLKLITDAAAKTPCVGPEDPANVAAWIAGAARRLEELEQERAQTLREATRLARVMWRRTYREAAPAWQPLSDAVGVITQIDNMHAGVLQDVEKCESEHSALRRQVRALFEQYLDVVEESDEGCEFRPTTIGTCRAMQAEPLGQLLLDLRAAVGLPPPEPLNVRDGEAAQ